MTLTTEQNKKAIDKEDKDFNDYKAFLRTKK